MRVKEFEVAFASMRRLVDGRRIELPTSALRTQRSPS
jgi:hypothetical protein